MSWRRWTASSLLSALLLTSCHRSSGGGGGPDHAALVDRGRYLVNAVVACGNCHTTADADENRLPGMELAGRDRRLPEGTWFSNANITPDPETGIGGWSEQDIMNVVRYGRRPDGTLVTSRMPIAIFRAISDNDLRAIAAYVKSVPAIRHAVHRANSRLDTPPPPGGYGAKISVPDTPRSDKVAYGHYLAYMAHCVECHTPLTDRGERDYANRFGAGGWPITDWKTGQPSNISKNITPDRENGIGAWTDAQIITAIRKGVRPDGGQLRWPMAFDFYKNMTDEDVADVVAYLRSLPPKTGFGETP